VTMFLSGGVLFLFGSGPVRGFAVTLMLGVVASMFTALIGSRALIFLVYGRRRRIERLAI
jgi:preprotein translocase subunit SecD